MSSEQLSPEVKEKVELAKLAIKAGYLSKPQAVNMCENNTVSEMKSKINRMIDTIDVPPSREGNQLVFKVMGI